MNSQNKGINHTLHLPYNLCVQFKCVSLIKANIFSVLETIRKKKKQEWNVKLQKEHCKRKSNQSTIRQFKSRKSIGHLGLFLDCKCESENRTTEKNT